MLSHCHFLHFTPPSTVSLHMFYSLTPPSTVLLHMFHSFTPHVLQSHSTFSSLTPHLQSHSTCSTVSLHMFYSHMFYSLTPHLQYHSHVSSMTVRVLCCSQGLFCMINVCSSAGDTECRAQQWQSWGKVSTLTIKAAFTCQMSSILAGKRGRQLSANIDILALG